MKKRAKQKGFNFPYLYDSTQKIGHDYGATVTPHVFVLDEQRKIAYIGAVDDNSRPQREETLPPRRAGRPAGRQEAAERPPSIRLRNPIRMTPTGRTSAGGGSAAGGGLLRHAAARRRRGHPWPPARRARPGPRARSGTAARWCWSISGLPGAGRV